MKLNAAIANLLPAKRQTEERYSQIVPFQDWVNLNFQGIGYPLPLTQTIRNNREEISGEYGSLVTQAFRANSVVAACMFLRLNAFCEARFQFQRIRAGRPQGLFSNDALRLLESPWMNGTTGDLLARMIQDVDLAGNSYTLRVGNTRLARLHPPWVGILLTGEDPDFEIAGYAYKPGGPYTDTPERFYPPEAVAHFAPLPDPQAVYRGMSWLTPAVREVMGDTIMTQHKIAYFEQGASPSTVVKLDVAKLSEFNEAVQKFREAHQGVRNAYEPVFVGAGADVTVIGNDMRELDYKIVQAAGETRIAADAGTPPVIVGLSEGLQGSSLNTGNYAAARRRFSDLTIHPLWRSAAGALATITDVPADARLWVDDRDIAFLKEDEKDAADIFAVDAQSYRTLVDGGVNPDSAKEAVAARDITLVNHTGLLSVQLQEPGTADPETNGKVPAELAPTP